MTGALPSIGLAMVAGAFLEFVLLRVVLRMGPSLPDNASLNALMAGGFQLGLWSLNAAAALAVVTLATVAVQRLSLHTERRMLPVAMLASAIGLVALWAISVAEVWSPSLVAVQVLGLPAVAAIAIVSTGLRSPATVWLAFAVLVQFLAAGEVVAAAPVWQRSTGIAEAGAVVAGVALPFAFRLPLRRGPLAAAAATALVYAALTSMEPTIARFLLIWDFGLPGALPGPLHAVALGAVVYAAAVGLRTPSLRMMTSGAVLIVLAGLRLDNTYFAALATCGIYLVLLSRVTAVSESTVAGGNNPRRRPLPVKAAQS